MEFFMEYCYLYILKSEEKEDCFENEECFGQIKYYVHFLEIYNMQ